MNIVYINLNVFSINLRDGTVMIIQNNNNNNNECEVIWTDASVFKTPKLSEVNNIAEVGAIRIKLNPITD